MKELKEFRERLYSLTNNKAISLVDLIDLLEKENLSFDYLFNGNEGERVYKHDDSHYDIKTRMDEVILDKVGSYIDLDKSMTHTCNNVYGLVSTPYTIVSKARLDKWFKVIQKLNVDPDWLITGKGTRPEGLESVFNLQELSARIFKIVKDTNSDWVDFSRGLGFSKSTVRQYIRDGVMPKFKFFSNLFKKYPNLDIEWVMTGVESEKLPSEAVDGQYLELKKMIDYAKNRIDQLVE